MRFVCSKHGEIAEPRNVAYSCPATAECPTCGEVLVDELGGIRVLTTDEAKKVRAGYQDARALSNSELLAECDRLLPRLEATLMSSAVPATVKSGILHTQIGLLEAKCGVLFAMIDLHERTTEAKP